MLINRNFPTGRPIRDGLFVALVCGAVAALVMSASGSEAQRAERQVLEIQAGVAHALGIQEASPTPYYEYENVEAPRPSARVIQLPGGVPHDLASRCPGFEVLNPEPGQPRCP